jgi:flagellar biosynthesis/type III secretory pathway chaperone
LNDDSGIRTEFLEVKQLVTDCITYTQSLNEHMQADHAYFSTQDLTALEQSDLKKSDIQAALSNLIEQLENHFALQSSDHDLWSKLSHYASQLDWIRQTQLSTLIQSLRQAYNSGLRLALINRQVVNANLTHLKTIISQLTQSSTDINSATYDHTGALS